MKSGTVRAACTRGKLKKYIGTEVKQSGSTWLVTKYVMNKEYGEETGMRAWVRNTYTVEEVEFDGDLHEFEIKRGDEVLAVITPATIEEMEQIIEDLDNGEDVNGWEDGMGNTINID